MEPAYDEVQGAYAAILRALLIRNGGAIVIAPEEMPDGLYTIGLHDTDEGGLEIVLLEQVETIQ